MAVLYLRYAICMLYIMLYCVLYIMLYVMLYIVFYAIHCLKYETWHGTTYLSKFGNFDVNGFEN